MSGTVKITCSEMISFFPNGTLNIACRNHVSDVADDVLRTSCYFREAKKLSRLNFSSKVFFNFHKLENSRKHVVILRGITIYNLVIFVNSRLTNHDCIYLRNRLARFHSPLIIYTFSNTCSCILETVSNLDIIQGDNFTKFLLIQT